MALAFEDGNTLEMVLPASGRGHQLEDGLTTLFAGEAADTTLAVQPTAEGIRGLVRIASSEAPERFEFAIEGDVHALELDPDGGVLALGSGGELIARADSPWAVDAQGAAVPTHFEVEGTTLIQGVEHRGRDWSYGIMADPVWAPIIAAAGWCATGVLSSVSSAVLLDIYHGKRSSRTTYVANAVVGCLLGGGTGLGKLAWKVLPAKTKKWAIRQVLRFVLWVGPKSRY